MNGGAWQSSTAFSDLTPNTPYQFEAYKTETATHLASEPSPPATFITDDDVSIEDNEFAGITIYSHLNSIYIKNESNITLKSVEILDITGRLVYQDAVNDVETVIMLHVSSGIYNVRLISQKNTTSTDKVWVMGL